MRHPGVRSAAVATIAALVPCVGLAACGGSDSSGGVTTSARSAPATVPNGAGTAAGASQATERDFDRGNFTHSTRIDNRFSPLVPGTQFVYEGRSNRGEGQRPHEVITTVTDLTKVIDGVRAVVIWERDINAGRLLEGELAFQAQDNDGNVWNLGEYPEEYDNGHVEGAPDTWIAGIAGAHGGIMMRAAPRTGTSSYRQGFAPAIEFADRAKVLRVGLRDCVPVRCFDNVLLTDETNPNEPADGHQRKSYAPGIGTIRAAPAGGKEREQLVLARVVRLDPEALAAVRRRALALDRRGYTVSRRVYGRTPRAKPGAPAGP
jgi:hypothetical protein